MPLGSAGDLLTPDLSTNLLAPPVPQPLAPIETSELSPADISNWAASRAAMMAPPRMPSVPTADIGAEVAAQSGHAPAPATTQVLAPPGNLALPPPPLNQLAPQGQMQGQGGPLRFGTAFGDSIAALQINHGAGGVTGPQYNARNPAPFVTGQTAGVGDPPERVLARLNDTLQENPDFFKGNSPTSPLFLSPGTSNNPQQMEQVQQILDRLNEAGVKNVVVPGVGPGVANYQDVNKQLQGMVSKAGYTYYDPSGLKWADGIHPANAVAMQQGALGALRPSIGQPLTPTIQQNVLSPQVPTGMLPSDDPAVRAMVLPRGSDLAPPASQTYTGPHADIYNAAVRWNVDPSLAMTTASIESNFRPGAVAGTHAGLFQLGDREWAAMGGGDRNDVSLQIDHGVRWLAQAQQDLSDRLGRTPTNSEVYLAHQQGFAGAAALINNPNMTAQQALESVGVPSDTAYASIRGNAGDPNAPASQFVRQWSDSYDAKLAGLDKMPAYTGPAVTPRARMVATGEQPPETTARRPATVLASGGPYAAGQGIRNALTPQAAAGGGTPGAGQAMSPEEKARQDAFRQQQGVDERQQRMLRALQIAGAMSRGIKFTPINYDPHRASGVPPAVPYRPIGGEQGLAQIRAPEAVRGPAAGTRPSGFESAEGEGVGSVLRSASRRRYG